MKNIFLKVAIGLISLSLLTNYGCDKENGGDKMSEKKSTEKTKERKDIDDEYKWDLTQVYSSDDEWRESFDALKKDIKSLGKYEGKLGSSAETLLKALELNDELFAEYEKLYQYASLSKDLDLTKTKYQATYEKIQSLGANLRETASFIAPELLSIDKSKLNSFMASNEELKVYEHKFDELFRMKEHTLPKEQERLLALASPIDQNFMTTYKMLVSADVKFPKVKNDKGEEIQMSPVNYYAALESTDRGFRERGYKAFLKPFMNYKNCLSSMYYGSVKSNVFQSKARNYSSTLEWSLDENNIPVEVYTNLIKSVNDNLKPLQRWIKIKKERLGLETAHPYDAYVTLFPEAKKSYTFEQAKEIVLDALKPLGEDYISKLKLAFDSRWIDVYETPHKRNGAYSSSAKKSKPFVLLNWGGELGDVFTLAHELGHSLHSLYSEETQPYPYADYPIFLAEVASTVNEALLLDYMIEKAESKEEKLALLERYINNIKSTFYRQTRFAEFEWKVQKMAENGEPLTAEKLKNIFGDMYQKYWGEAMTVDEEEKYSWSRVHHFFYDYYVYSYATSFSAAQVIAENIKKQGAPAIEKHLEFLKSGSSDFPIPTLKRNGVDLTSPKPIEAVAMKMNELLDEMEKLLN